MLILVALMFGGFAVFGSAVPGFSSTVVMWWMGIASVSVVVLTSWRTIWNVPRLAYSVSSFVVATILVRGTLAWVWGGTERVGVFFLYAVAAVAVANSLSKEAHP